MTGFSRFAPLALIALTACQPAAPKQMQVENGWVRLPAVPGRPGAAYFAIRGGPAAARLVSIRSIRVGRIELHESKMEGGMMTMKPLAGVGVPAGGRAVFAPGAAHAMLFQIDPTLTPGTDLPLTFRFADGHEIRTAALVVAAGAGAPY